MLIFSACREEIIAPEDTSGLLNTPYANKFSSFYDFQINAQKLNLFFADNLPGNPNVNRINILTSEVGEGKLVLRLLDNYSRIVLIDTLVGDVAVARQTELGLHPSKLEFEFLNFSGRFKFQMYSNN